MRTFSSPTNGLDQNAESFYMSVEMCVENKSIIWNYIFSLSFFTGPRLDLWYFPLRNIWRSSYIYILSLNHTEENKNE